MPLLELEAEAGGEGGKAADVLKWMASSLAGGGSEGNKGGNDWSQAKLGLEGGRKEERLRSVTLDECCGEIAVDSIRGRRMQSTQSWS